MKVRVGVNINTKKLEQQFQSLVDDDCMYQIHNLFYKMNDPYVPMDEGVLAQNHEITKDYVAYRVPYAHYQYVGEVYGPNIPLIEDGIVVGWFSPPGQKKHPTGQEIQYNTEKHPLASKEWDKAMMRDKGDIFLKQVADILVQRCKELYG